MSTLKKPVINCLWEGGYEGQLCKKVLILKIKKIIFELGFSIPLFISHSLTSVLGLILEN